MADRKKAKELVDDVLGPTEMVAIREVIARFNSLYSVVNEAGKAIILQSGFDPVLNRGRYDRLTTKDLRTLYMNELVQVGTKEDGSPIMKGVADIWLQSADRKQFIIGITFDPTNRTQPGVLNLWQGYAVKPAPGDWSLMREHILNIICDRDPTRYNYTMGWLARLFQRPAEQGEVAIVMKGGEGTGKGTLARAVKHIIGHHALAISNGKHLTGNFNAHLRDVVFLFADEAFFAGDRAHVGVLKSIITEPHLTIEAKNVNAVEAPNYLHLMMASNEEWVVPAAMDARRFLVHEVSDERRNDHAYFAAIWHQMEAGGYAAMLHDLLAFDLSGFNVRAVPTTEGLQRQRKLSLQTTEAWWLDCLERGYVFKSKLGLEDWFAVWPDRATTELLFASYLEFAKGRNERRIMSRESLGRFLAPMGYEPSRWRNGIVGEHLTDEKDVHGRVSRVAKPVTQDRTTGYHLGTLQAARTAFLRVTGLCVIWEDGVSGLVDDGE